MHSFLSWSFVQRSSREWWIICREATRRTGLLVLKSWWTDCTSIKSCWRTTLRHKCCKAWEEVRNGPRCCQTVCFTAFLFLLFKQMMAPFPGVDVSRFTSDAEYKHETILGLAMWAMKTSFCHSQMPTTQHTKTCGQTEIYCASGQLSSRCTTSLCRSQSDTRSTPGKFTWLT